ncbi:MAG: tRNA (guanine-N(7)-)-methyltransferase [Betaproteobacteria bacterium ADurb.Bin341]|nr:MAG: tRNA (guanine-N(7)-)-methyltransferase [Betaproteobacteria bacterium ADurb.Bin341]
MNAASRPVHSGQEGPHRDLDLLLRRHAAHPYLKPLLEHNQQAFDTAIAAWQAWNKEAPLVLDAGCGVGWSTLKLAERFPEHFVLGVDQSLDRLSRGKPMPLPDNAAFVRADLVDFWRLLHAAGVTLARHYLLYPNPWPKIGHLGRRWHGHPVFPVLLALGGQLECRSNWRIYVEELAQAITLLTGVSAGVEDFDPGDEPLTPFEAKYAASGHRLYRLVAELS